VNEITRPKPLAADRIEFKQAAYALDRDSRKAALARFLKRVSGSDQEAAEEERRLAA
jgi:hypothetical protein